MMKKIVFLFSFIFIFLFFWNNEAWGVGESCTCYFDAWDLIEPCKDQTPPSCNPGETCSCTPEVDTFSGAPIGCYPGTCILESTPIPTPTGPPHGTCDPYMTVTGCSAINIHCDSGYTPVVSADCSFCWCELVSTSPSPDGGCDNGGIQTAIGCINVTGPTGFVGSVLKLALGVGGGIALLLIIFGAFQILASSGNPEKIKAGKELITSAIAGLLMIIFSLFLLQLIGVKILQIPGFGTP